MAVAREQLIHRRRCRLQWALGSLAAWDALAHAPLLLAHARDARPSPQHNAWPLRHARPFHERVGAIHVHTTYSDGLSSFEEVAAVAGLCGLDFMITADHNTLAPLRDGKQGYYGDCLVMVGMEITCQEGYVLALDLPPEFAPAGRDAAGVLRDIRAAGGLGFVALACDPRFAWRALPESDFVGMEIANLGSMAFRRINLPNLIRAGLRCRRSGSVAALAACRPTPELRAWDRITRQRPVVGIGSVDAHSLLKVCGRRLRIPSYADSFGVLRAHLLCREAPSGDVRRDAALHYDAIAAGRCFFAFHTCGDAAGFRFIAASAAENAVMGEPIFLGDGVRLQAALPTKDAIFRLLRDGRSIATVRGAMMDHLVQEPGVYRVEVYRADGRLGPFCLHLRPWVFSNPVYVRPGHAAHAGRLSPAQFGERQRSLLQIGGVP